MSRSRSTLDCDARGNPSPIVLTILLRESLQICDPLYWTRVCITHLTTMKRQISPTFSALVVVVVVAACSSNGRNCLVGHRGPPGLHTSKSVSVSPLLRVGTTTSHLDFAVK